MLQGLTVEIDTFHGSDARVYQLPTILQLSERLDLSSYPSAQTPLFHLIMAGWGKLVGFELWKLRLLSVAISYGMALALLHLLRRATPLGRLAGVRADPPLHALALRLRRLLHAAHRQPGAAVRAAGPGADRALPHPAGRSPPSRWPAWPSRARCSPGSRSSGSRWWPPGFCCAAGRRWPGGQRGGAARPRPGAAGRAGGRVGRPGAPRRPTRPPAGCAPIARASGATR